MVVPTRHAPVSIVTGKTSRTRSRCRATRAATIGRHRHLRQIHAVSRQRHHVRWLCPEARRVRVAHQEAACGDVCHASRARRHASATAAWAAGARSTARPAVGCGVKRDARPAAEARRARARLPTDAAGARRAPARRNRARRTRRPARRHCCIRHANAPAAVRAAPADQRSARDRPARAAKPDAAVTDRRRVAEAKGRAHVGGGRVVPRPAAMHAVRWRGRTGRINRPRA